MLTKSDIRSISTLLDNKLSPLKKDLSGVKQDVSSMKKDLSGVQKDVSVLKQDVSGLKQDVSSIKQGLSTVKNDVDAIKSKLNDFASLMLSAVNSILEWTQDIHETIVKEKLPQRVKKLEQLLRSS